MHSKLPVRLGKPAHRHKSHNQGSNPANNRDRNIRDSSPAKRSNPANQHSSPDSNLNSQGKRQVPRLDRRKAPKPSLG